MNMFLKGLILLSFAAFFVSCSNESNTGVFKLSLTLPENTLGSGCQYAKSGDDDLLCILADDQIEITRYRSKNSPAGPYDSLGSSTISVNAAKGEQVIDLLESGSYYKFFIKVTNKNQKVKLTGGIEGIKYDQNSNYNLTIFLGPAGDYTRVVNNQTQADSMTTYISQNGSSGAKAVALRDGRVMLLGGIVYDDLDNAVYSKQGQLYDFSKLSSSGTASLPFGIRDFAAALLHFDKKGDNASNTGKVVVAFGEKAEGEYSNTIYLYNPDANKYETAFNAPNGGIHARAITVGGEVYISGGCEGETASKAVYFINKTGAISEYATLNTGRCLHSMIDMSDYDAATGAISKVRILIIGGATKNITKETDGALITDDSFAELIEDGVVTKLAPEKLGFEAKATLASAASSTLKWTNEKKGPVNDKVGLLIGGFTQPDTTKTNISNSQYAYIVRLDTSNTETPWSSKKFSVSLNDKAGCAYPSVGNITPNEISLGIQYAALNCGTSDIKRELDNRTSQYIYVLEARASATEADSSKFDIDLSIRNTIWNTPKDDANYGTYLDGPVATNTLGQSFLFGTEYIYLVSGFSQ